MLIHLHILRGCSYGGGLSRLTGLARLAEILPFYKNVLKKKLCSYDNRASPPCRDLGWFNRELGQAGWKFSIWTLISADRDGNSSFIKTKNKNILLCILFKLLIYHLQWSVFFFYDFLTFFKKDEITIIWTQGKNHLASPSQPGQPGQPTSIWTAPEMIKY